MSLKGGAKPIENREWGQNINTLKVNDIVIGWVPKYKNELYTESSQPHETKVKIVQILDGSYKVSYDTFYLNGVSFTVGEKIIDIETILSFDNLRQLYTEKCLYQIGDYVKIYKGVDDSYQHDDIIEIGSIIEKSYKPNSLGDKICIYIVSYIVIRNK